MARDKLSYEWHIECADEYGDVENVDFAETLVQALAAKAMYANQYAAVEIALVRDEGNDFDGIKHRGYAYLRDGALEPNFSSYHLDGKPANDGPDVPQRFHKEVASSLALS